MFKKIICVSFSLVALHAGAMEKNKVQIPENILQTQSNSGNHISPKDFIIAGVVAGGAIECVNYARKEERYKNILKFGRKYPGFFIAGFTATLGTGYLYSHSIASLFKTK